MPHQSPPSVIGLVDFAGRVLYGGDTLHAAGRTMPTTAAASFGADGPGRLGELGRHLHAQYDEAVSHRAAEATSHSRRLQETAVQLGEAAARYADADVVVSTELASIGDDLQQLAARPPARTITISSRG